MAGGNQGQGQNQGQGHSGQGNSGQGNKGNRPESRQNGGIASTAREAVQGAGESIQQGYEQVANRIQGGYDASREQVAHQYRAAEGVAARNPSTSILVGFGLGVGLGIALTSLLVGREETWAEKHVPDSVRDLPDRLRKLRAQDVADQIPASWHSTFHHLADSIRDLPSVISKQTGR